MNLKSFFALLKNPSLMDEGRVYMKIDYDNEEQIQEAKDDFELQNHEIKESA